MSYISFSIWQIRLIREDDFKKALIGFQKDSENKLLKADNPFKFYDRLKESQIFRFLKLIGCDNNQVGEFAKFVKRRNKIAHPSGTVFFNDRDTIDNEISEMMREVTKIQTHMNQIIEEIYQSFLVDNSDIDEREYGDPVQEIEINLIHKNYISNKDLEVCINFDILKFNNHPNHEGIYELHNTLVNEYHSSDEEG